MNAHLKIIGILLILLALIHIAFPKYFNWGKELKQLSLINRQMMAVHTFFIALVVFLIGLLSLTQHNQIVSTPLGKIIALGLGIFWGVRLVFQLVVYSKKLWKGKRFETIIHILFTGLWTYFSVVFFMVYFEVVQ